MEDEFRVLQSVAKLLLHLEESRRNDIHLLREELEIVAATVFGRIHRRVGTLHQCLRVTAVFGEEADANRGRRTQ